MEAALCWEYAVMRAHTNDLVKLDKRLNDAGLAGWEVVGFAAADKTLGLNEYAAILKRAKLPPFPPPVADMAAAWHPDPTGRHELRWWDGLRWTDKVHDQGKASIDPPLPDATR